MSPSSLPPPTALDEPLALLGGWSPRQFLKRHWQKRPLLVRQAIPGFAPLLSRAELMRMAQSEDVESRLVEQRDGTWRLRHGPLRQGQIPPFKRSGWTVLIQGVDLHSDQAHGLLRRFAFLPAARLDDLMISHASDGGGVGPHFDSYDVFLLQAQGRRRWRIGRQRRLDLVPDLPVKILAEFEPEEEYVLEPGDMLYLPPRWAHDGIAEGECQTYSIGFRAPRAGELARELLGRLAEDAPEEVGDTIYSDAADAPSSQAACVPGSLQSFAQAAVQRAITHPDSLARALGEYLTEPKPQVWFETASRPAQLRAVRLDRRTRMLYDGRHVFANGESWRAGGRDAAHLRELADARVLPAERFRRASAGLRDLLADWCEAGWAHAC